MNPKGNLEANFKKNILNSQQEKNKEARQIILTETSLKKIHKCK